MQLLFQFTLSPETASKANKIILRCNLASWFLKYLWLNNYAYLVLLFVHLLFSPNDSDYKSTLSKNLDLPSRKTNEQQQSTTPSFISVYACQDKFLTKLIDKRKDG